MAMRSAELYGELSQLEALTDEYHEAAFTDPKRLEALREQILELAGAHKLDQDCLIDPNASAQTKLTQIDDYLCTLKERQIRDGLHILGSAPTGKRKARLMLAIARAKRGDAPHQLGITSALAEDLKLSIDPRDCNLAQEWQGERPKILMNILSSKWRTNGDTIERLEALALSLIAEDSSPKNPKSNLSETNLPKTKAVLDWMRLSLSPSIKQGGKNEFDNLLRGMAGKFVPPGPSGAPTRGRADVLPTGRNFYSIDPKSLPTPTAWSLGWKSATRLIAEYKATHKEYPRKMGLSAWGTSNMRTGGDDISQAMALLGVKPTWEETRVMGFEILPLEVLTRPRVDVTLRVSGFFRDAFPNLIALFDKAVRAVANLNEEPAQNPLKQPNGNLFRVFGPKPGAYGAGLQALIDEKGWESKKDLANIYLEWGSTAYTAQNQEGEMASDAFKNNIKGLDAVIHNQDNYEHDILDSDDYYQFVGGMSAAVTHLSGKEPVVYMNDHSVTHSPRIQTLPQEIAKVVRSRAANPLWIEGVMRHGYRGAAEMAATVDYLFAFAATTSAVKNHHFDMLFKSYLEDQKVLKFIERNNKDALNEMTAKFEEAITRGLWKPQRNSVFPYIKQLQQQ